MLDSKLSHSVECWINTKYKYAKDFLEKPIVDQYHRYIALIFIWQIIIASLMSKWLAKLNIIGTMDGWKRNAHTLSHFFFFHTQTHTTIIHTPTGQQTNETHKNLYWSTGSTSELQEWTEKLSDNLVLFVCVWHNRSFAFICACHCNENLFYFWTFDELINISHLTFRTSSSRSRSSRRSTLYTFVHRNRQHPKISNEIK